MATRIKEGMTGAEVAQIIDNGFDNLEELNQRVEINETALEDIKNMSFVSELMGIGTTKEEVNINYRGKSLGSSFEEEFQRTIPSASTLNAGVMTAADKVRLDNTCTVFMLDVDHFDDGETYEGELTSEEVSLLVDTYTKGGIVALWVDEKTTLYSDAIDITDGIITITFSESSFSLSLNLKTLNIVLRIALDFKYTINSNIYEIHKSGEGTKFLSDDGSYKTIADEEDITAEDGNLKLKDRAYDEANFSGKGYKILRKNILLVTVPKFDLTINTGCTANGNITINEISIEVTTEASTPEAVALLIQSAISGTTISGAIVTFTSNPTVDYSTTGVSGLVVDNSYLENRNILTLDMVKEANTVYEIRYDFDLNSSTINIPEGCTLKFNGGNLYNGTLNGTDTNIENINININIKYEGNFRNINNTIVYNSIDELKNSNINLPGFNVSTLGYYERNDGGAADYFIINKDESYIPDLGSCIELSNGKYAILVAKNGEINALQFGAKSCNYFSDFYDSTQNLQDALNYVSYYIQTDINKTNYKVGKLLINGLFFTKELNLISTNNSNKIEIVGYNPYASKLMYIGDKGYSGDGINFDTDSYILKVNANNQFHILNIGFIGAIDYKDESKLKSVASYGLIIENYYDWGTKIEGCYFTQFVMCGLYINCSLLNGYLLNNRWDTAGKNYIYIKKATSLKINNFTIDTKFHNFQYRNNTFKNIFKSLPWCKDLGIEENYPNVGNCFLYFENISATGAIQIDTARVEGGNLVKLNNSASSFITIEDCTQLNFDYKPSINISNINFSIENIDSLIKLKTHDVRLNPRLIVNGVNTIKQIIPISYETDDASRFNRLYTNIQMLPKNVPTPFYYISSMCNQQNVTSTTSFSFNGMKFSVDSNKESDEYFTYNDIIFNTRTIATINLKNDYNCIGYSCIRPLIGYGKNVSNAWFPAAFEATLNSDKTITTNKKLNINVSYTVTYNDNTEQDICCTESELQEDGTYLNKFEYNTISKDTQTVTMQETKCEWRPFGRRELAANPGIISNRPTTNLINGDKYINTDTKKETIYINGKWYNPDGLEESISNTGTFSQKPTVSQGISVGFQYFCTDKQTTEGTTNGIIIYHKGGDIWVDALGRVIQ